MDPRVRELFEKGKEAYHRGRFSVACKAFRSALRRAPESLEIQNYLAVSLCRLDRPVEARRHLERCCRQAPDQATYHFNLAMVLTRLGKADSAIDHLTKAIALDARFGAAYLHRAGLLAQSRAFRQSLKDFRKAIRLGFDATDHLVDAAKVASRANRWRDAEAWLRKAVALDPDDGLPLYELALALDSMGRKDDAIEVHERLSSLDPDFFEARMHHATLLASLRPRGDHFRDEAIHALTSLLKRRKIRKNHRQDLHRAYFLLGSLYDDLPEDYPRAVRAYKKGLELSPDDAVVHTNLGAIYLSQGHTGLAVKHIRRALVLEPSHTKAYQNLARLYYHHRTEKELQEDLERFIEEAPDTAARLLMGVTVHIVDLAQREAYEDFYSRGHKLKNLLAIQGSRLRRLAAGTDGASPDGPLQHILHAHEEIYEGIVGYLQVIRPQEVRLETVDLGALVDRTVKRLSHGLPESVRLRINLVEDMPPLAADAGRLVEAVENLWTNAVEAMEADGGVLRIRTGVDRPRHEVFLSVADSGRGIPTEAVKQVFRTGFTTKDSGSGLGLAIVKRIVTDHSGMIELRSRPGRGTTITLRFPLKVEVRARRAAIAMRPLLSVDSCSLIVDELA